MHIRIPRSALAQPSPRPSLSRGPQEAKKEREEGAARAREEMQQEVAAVRAENGARISSLQAESDELMARLGISKPARKASGSGAS
jgi:hypothetical protein